MGWVSVCSPSSSVPEELQTESDGSLLLSVVRTTNPGVTTLKFRNKETGNWRVVRSVQGIMTPPEEAGWGGITYITVGGTETEPKGKANKGVVLKLQEADDCDYDDGGFDSGDDESTWSSSIYCLFDNHKLLDTDFQQVFGHFGTVTNVGVRAAQGTGIVTFDDPKVPMSLYGKDISVGGTALDIKEPESDDKERRKLAVIFRNEDIKVKDLWEHFGKYGKVTDVYVPRPFRYFGFVTYSKESTCRKLYNRTHRLKGSELRIQKPKGAKNNYQGGRSGVIKGEKGWNDGKTWVKGETIHDQAESRRSSMGSGVQGVQQQAHSGMGQQQNYGEMMQQRQNDQLLQRAAQARDEWLQRYGYKQQ
eukprot:GFUD01027267.1.p1 GENE.GFUD01027267.1~~GFUD01027267.1.p1  ORF type:complete len:362 (-),score=103.35 GFUD01027267.1:100-1185(-)